MRARAIAFRTEDSLATLAFAGIMILPLAEIAVRLIWSEGIRGAGPFALNLTLWVGLLGAAIAAREGKLLTLATGEFIPKGAVESVAHVITGFVGAAVATLFVMGGIGFTRMLYQSGEEIALGIRLWEAVLVIPFAFGL